MTAEAGTRPDEGLMTTELVIAFPFLIFLTFAPVHFALYWHARQVADLAASQALDVAVVEGVTDTEAEAAAYDVASSAGQLEGVTIQITHPTARDVEVTVTGRPRFRIFPGDWSVQSQTQGRREQFLADGDR